MNQEDKDYALLRSLKADWQKDSLGVRGNPVEMMRQQAPLDIPRSNVVRRFDNLDVQQLVDNSITIPQNPNVDVPQPPDQVPPTGNDPPPTPPPTPEPNLVTLHTYQKVTPPHDIHYDFCEVFSPYTGLSLGVMWNANFVAGPTGSTWTWNGVTFYNAGITPGDSDVHFSVVAPP